MRFMIIIKADEKSEAGILPSEQLLTDMSRYNQELVNAGVLLAGEGLHPSSKGARVHFSGNDRTVVDGPFSEAKELIAGFWLSRSKSDRFSKQTSWARPRRPSLSRGRGGCARRRPPECRPRRCALRTSGGSTSRPNISHDPHRKGTDHAFHDALQARP